MAERLRTGNVSDEEYLEDYPNENWSYIIEIMLCDL